MDDGDANAAAASDDDDHHNNNNNNDDNDNNNNKCVWVYYDDLFPHDQMMYQP